MKNTIIATSIIIVILAGFGAYFLFFSPPNNTDANANPTPSADAAIETAQNETQNKESEVIGQSVEKRDIVAYHFLSAGAAETVASTTKEIIFVGGIHGGYEWNTALVAYEAMDYLKANPDIIPDNLKVTVIPVLNPDGLFKVVGMEGRFTPGNVASSQAVQILGRFNGNKVDLNRNFDCDWKTEGKWQNTAVSGGTEVFSEPESQAFKNYIETNKPVAVVVWFSAAGGVYASNCHSGVLKETGAIMKKFADASGYPAYQSFDFYAITGDMTNWLAKINIPAISVLLTNHTDTEWTKNLAGITALLSYYR